MTTNQHPTGTHYVVDTHIGVRWYDNRTEPFTTRESAESFARRCGGTARGGGVVGSVRECGCRA